MSSSSALTGFGRLGLGIGRMASPVGRVVVAPAALVVALSGCVVHEWRADRADLHTVNGCDVPIFAAAAEWEGDLQGFQILAKEPMQPGERSTMRSIVDLVEADGTLWVWVEPEGSTRYESEPFAYPFEDMVPGETAGDYDVPVSGEMCP